MANVPHPQARLPETRAPWRAPRGLAATLSQWRDDSKLWRNVALEHQLQPKQARTAPFPDRLAPSLRSALEASGIESLFTHQAQAFGLACAGHDIVVSTPTASGKSLCYNLPVVQRILDEPSASALYLFPTKALSRDQEHALRNMMQAAGVERGAITFDGDTPADARRAAKQRGSVILSNPDMLHAGILPHHTSWARWFAQLRYVVVDELHMYRGVFGSHLANVLRRLMRVALFHGASPTFIFASATIGNPQEHASRMVGREVQVIGESGAPAGPRSVLVYNPPVLNPELGIRASYIKTAVRLAGDLMQSGVPTLVFGQSRNSVETMLKYLRDRLARAKIAPSTVHAYRGGYLPQTRRRIENGLRDGTIRGVVATNALELGIDIGSLDAVVCAGYPGTAAGLWQRFGRAGRRQEGSLALLVTSSAPLDQFVGQDANYILGAPIEEARIDPDNVEILVQHLKCAAFELPFEDGELFGDLPPEAVHDVLQYLHSHQLVHPVQSGNGRTVYHWSSNSYPANSVSLRSASWDNFVIIERDKDRILAEMDWRSVHTMLHEQAIYQHNAEQYQVEKLDFENHKAFVRKVKPDYYTDALSHVKVTILEPEERAFVGETTPHPLQVGYGTISVVEKVVGYKKIKFHTHENAGYGDVHLPEMQMHTSGWWLTFPAPLLESMQLGRAVLLDALRGLGHALHTVAAVALMTDPRDLGVTVEDDSARPDGSKSGRPFEPTLFVYDRVAGGIGLAARMFDHRETLLRRTRALIEGCTCTEGCPACVGPEDIHLDPKAPDAPPASRRSLALKILSSLNITPTH